MTLVSCHCEVPKARHHVSQYSCASSSHCEGATHVDMLTTLDILSCHCEGERSEAVAIAKSLELNEITTTCATPHNDKYVSEARRKELNVLTSYRLNDFKKKVAFTLAEVLITLAIIGIVAAMTIPTLISSYKKKQTVTKLKQTYSILSQALTMAQVKEGDSSSWDLSGIYGTSDKDPNFSKEDTITNFAEKYLMPNLKVAQNYGYTFFDESKGYIYGDNVAEAGYFFMLPNGVFVRCTLGKTACIGGTNPDGTCVSQDYQNIIFNVDVNGFQKPNSFGSDIFFMMFDVRKKVFGFHHIDNHNDDRDYYISICGSSGQTCGYLIYLDGWEIKDDYPYGL